MSTPARNTRPPALSALLGSEERPIERAYPGFRLGPLTLDLPSHGIVAVLGDNGAGKSTLFEQIRARVRDSNLRCTMLPQDFTLPPFARVEDLVLFVAQQRIDDADTRKAAANETLTLTNLTDVARRSVRQLSGGMRRRLGIALTVLGGPDLVILDEPSAGLDMTQRTELRELLQTLGHDHLVLVSSHIIEDIKHTANYVVMLVAGTKVFEGTSEEFLSHGDPTAADAWERAYGVLNKSPARGGDS